MSNPFKDQPANSGADSVEACIRRAQSARAAGHREQALQLFEQALALQRTHKTVPIDIAVELRELGRFEQAEQHLQVLLQQRPDWFEAWAERGRLARKQRRHGDALVHFETALKLRPQHDGVAVDCAAQLRELGRLDEAQAQLDAVLAVKPDQFNAHAEYGRLARKQNHREAALGWFRKALVLKPEHVGLPIDIAVELRELNRLSESEEILNAVLARQASNFDALLESARLARRQGNSDIALQRFRAAQLLRPSHEGVAAGIAALLAESGAAGTSASKPASPAIPAPSAADLHAQGNAALQNDDIDEALRCFVQAIRLAPEQPQLHQALINLQRRLGCLDEADQSIAAARAALPQLLLFDLLAIRLLISRGQLEAALVQLKQCLSRHPGKPEILALLARQQILTADFSGAETSIAALPTKTEVQRRTVLELRISLARARFDINHAHELIGQWLSTEPNEATALWQQSMLFLAEGNLKQGALSLERALAAGNAPNVQRGLQLQLLREMRTNPFAERALESALQRPLTERVEAIAEVLDSEPDYIGSAMSMMLSLRRLGVLTPVPDREPKQAGRVPRSLVHFCSDSPLPGDAAENIASWQQHCTAYTQHVFDEPRAEAFIAAECKPAILQAFRTAARPAMRSDLFRLAYLYARGGVFASHEDGCRHSIEPWLSSGCEILLLQDETGAIANNFIAACPGHPLIGEALSRVASNLNSRQGGSAWFVTGAGVLTQSFCALYLEQLRRLTIPAGVQFIDHYHAHQLISLQLQRRYQLSERPWSVNKQQKQAQFRPNTHLRVRKTAQGFVIETSEAPALTPVQ